MDRPVQSGMVEHDVADAGVADGRRVADPLERVEQALRASLPAGRRAPPLLHQAIEHAVFPAGGRVRPRVCLAVNAAEGGAPNAIGVGAAAAIELLHCASLVHDDMPCFDDAATRRGKPSVHARFGEPLALLAGDAMIVAAFGALARGCVADPIILPALTDVVARAVDGETGIVAGQAWESEPGVDLRDYHDAKTGALFIAAARAGALAAGDDPARWTPLGRALGRAYQVADDLRDALLSERDLGKPRGQDARHERPSATTAMGARGALGAFRDAIEMAVDAIPPCRRRDRLVALVRGEAQRLVPAAVAARAA